MTDKLPKLQYPQWLRGITKPHAEEGQFPLHDLLKDSLYYPAAGFDGLPVEHLAGNFYSFIYVDYSISHDRLKEEVEERGFLGYSPIICREVSEQELAPNGWTLPPLKEGDGDPSKHRELIVKPYCLWYVFERDEDRSESHGPSRFSLLYLCADGVAAFHALYTCNKQHPKAVAVIQPGTGWGGNWTNFEDPEKIFARTVLGNPSGKPELLLFGGIGSHEFYEETCWPDYSKQIHWFDKEDDGKVGIWKA